MPDAPKPPSPVLALFKASRWVLRGIGELVRYPDLIDALNRELGVTHQPDLGGAQAKVAEVQAKLDEQIAQIGPDTGLEDEIFDFLMGGRQFFTLIKLIVGDAGGDEQRAKDLAWAALTLIASEKLRHEAPLAYAALRMAMIGYENAEAVPRLDPLAIFDRLTGQAARVPGQGYGPLGWAGMLGVTTAVIGGSVAFDKLLANDRTDSERTPGTAYLEGVSDFRIGWEPDPNGDPALQAMLARTLTWQLGGAIKRQSMPGEATLSSLLTMLVMEAADGGPGLLFRLSASGSGEIDVQGDPPGPNRQTIRIEAGGVGALDWMRLSTPDDWNDAAQGGFDNWRYIGTSGGNPSFKIVGTVAGPGDTPAFQIGKSSESRLEIGAFGFGFAAEGGSPSVFMDVAKGKLVLRPGDLGHGIGRFFKAVGAEGLEAEVDGRIRTTSSGRIRFEGEAELRTRLLSGLGNDHVRVDYVDVELGRATGGGLKLGFASAGRFRIGPFAASLERFGFDYLFTGEHRGSVELVPPRGIGIRLDLGFMRGGGFLLLDYERGEFAGAFEFSLFGFTLGIIVLVNTRAEGVPFAFLAMVHARFPGGLELGLRFTLNAVGGMIGVNHGFDYQALVAAMPNGALDDILFPSDPVGDAPRVLASLRTICPIEPGGRTLAVMAELGWGSDYICALRLGVVLPLDDMSHIYLLAQVRLTCFTDMPPPVRLQLICDAVGEIGFDPFALRIDGRLRDSRFGVIGIEGQLVFLLKTGSQPRFVIAAGGFHPNFKDVPKDLPAKIDRLAVTYDIGVVKAWVRGYFAVAAGTIQFGVDLGVRYKAGPLSFTGNLAIDALIHLDPFAFEAGISFNVALEFRGHELMGVHIKGTLWGPDSWRIKGRGEFSILFWDVGIDFDESWGDDVGTQQQRIPLAALVQADLDDAANWRFELPGEGQSVVTLRETTAAEGLLAHPLARLAFRQRRLPFGLALDRVGSARIDGLALFPVPTVTAANGAALTAETVLDPFAVGEYLDLDDEARLARPSFDMLASGVAAGSADYQVGSGAVAVDVDYEQLFLPTRNRFNHHSLAELRGDLLGHILLNEAAGRSEARLRQRTVRVREPVKTMTPDWQAVTAVTLEPVTVGAAPAAVLAKAAAPVGRLLVEQYEMAA